MFTVSRLASCSSWISILQSTRNAQNILYVLDFQVRLCFALAGNPISSSTTHTPGTCLRDIIRLPRLRMPGPSIFTPIGLYRDVWIVATAWSRTRVTTLESCLPWKLRSVDRESWSANLSDIPTISHSDINTVIHIESRNPKAFTAIG